jgi:hypothetical protein
MCYCNCPYESYDGECKADKKRDMPNALCNYNNMHDQFEKKFGHEPNHEELSNYINQEMSEYGDS